VIVIGIFIAVLLVFYIIRRVYRQSSLHNLGVELSFSSLRATEGAKLTLTTILTNSKWLPLPWVAVKFNVSRHLLFDDTENAQVSDNYYRNDLYSILMRQRITRRLSFVCGRRGYYAIPTIDLSAWDLLMETKNAEMVECGAHLTVYPASLPIPEVDDICVQIYGHMRARNIMHPDPFSFRGLREYSPNDPLKAINFKASAKAQELMVNLWEYMNAREVILLYNVQRYTVWHNEVLDEYTIKLVAGLAEKLARENVPVRFITNGLHIQKETDPEPANNHEGNFASILLGELKRESRYKEESGYRTTEVSEGLGELQHERILEALALLDLEQTNVTPFAEILANVTAEYKTEPEYWIISTYHGADMEDAYKDLKAKGARVVWMLPFSVGLRTGEDYITLSPEVREQVILL